MKSTSFFLTLFFTILLAAPSLEAAPGELDPNFGTGGIVTTDLTGFQNFGGNMDLLEDGKIVVVSSGGAIGTRDFGLIRYMDDGTLDSGFGTGGKVATSLGPEDALPVAVAVRSDGKIVLVGNAESGVDRWDVGIVRYNSDGTEDINFGTNGVVIPITSGNDEWVEDMVLQPDGKIIVIGTADKEFMFVMRYLSDGTPDTSFDNDGVVLIKVNGNDSAGRGVALQDDGKIVVVGSAGLGTDASMAVVRLNEDGSLDSNFGSDGTVNVATELMGGSGDGVAIQTDGKIVIVGTFVEASATSLVMARLMSDGTLDPDFGSSGIVTQSFVSDCFNTEDVALQINGSIVVTGLICVTPLDGDVTAVRFDYSGSIDTTFGIDGIVTHSLSKNERVEGLAIQPDGKILIGGSDGIDIALLRLLGSSAELSVSKTSNKTEAKVGDTITFTVSVANDGPDPAGARLDDTLPTQLDLVTDSVTTAAGNCITEPTFTCFLGVDASGSADVTYEAKATAEGKAENTASITSEIEESDTSDNSTTLSVTILSGAGCQLIR